jgi:hypothetical protein
MALGSFVVTRNQAILEADHGPLPRRIADWQSFLSRHVLGLHVFADAGLRFASSARIGDFGALSITRYEVTPQTMARTGRLTQDGDRGFSFTVVESGSIIARRDRRATAIKPGQAVILPAGSSSTFHIIEPSVFWGIKLVDPSETMRADLDEETAGLPLFCGKTIDILASYCQLIDQLPSGARSEEVARTITAHLFEFVETSLHSRTGS